jgi:hypothetical protein
MSSSIAVSGRDVDGGLVARSEEKSRPGDERDAAWEFSNAAGALRSSMP